MNEDLKRIISQEVFFAKEAAQYLNISPQRLNQLVHSGQIHPIKQTSAGTLFLKSDLEERKELLKNTSVELNKPTFKKKLRLDSVHVVEAINYYTIQAFYKHLDKATEPVFLKVSQKIDITLPLIKNINELVSILGISAETLMREYDKTRRSFEGLNENDLIVKRGTGLYPTLLANTKEAPPFLFMRGKVELLRERIVAVVGTREPSDEGRDKAYKLSKLLGKHNIVVASGLARGIDTWAHRGALDSKNMTIAVIGTPINRVYPKENENLQHEIFENGLVISQFSPSAPVERWHFPLRNSVMSGISLATVIVEAGETSGALKQADYALKQGRFVFIPQSALENPNITWPKKYIEKPGAHKFSKIEELIQKLEERKIIDTMPVKQDPLFEDGGSGQNVLRI